MSHPTYEPSETSTVHSIRLDDTILMEEPPVAPLSVYQRGISGAMFEAATDVIVEKVAGKDVPGEFPLGPLRRLSSRRVVVKRPVYTQQEFDDHYGAMHPEEVAAWQKTRSTVLTKVSDTVTRCRSGEPLCDRKRSKRVLFQLFPCANILWNYDVNEWLVHDVIAGLTVGIMHIPQGMAYAMLGSLPPVYGLYTSFFPTLVYFFFGTSRQISLGTIAIVSLLTGTFLDKAVQPRDLMEKAANFSQSLIHSENSNGTSPSAILNQLVALEKAKYASALACTVGFIQIAMGLLRMGFLTRYLSDPFVSGYTIGAAVHVFTSQIKSTIGVKIKKHTGAFNVPLTYYEIFRNFPHTNPITLAITGVSIALLVLFKEVINPRVSKYTKAPIPIELIIVILGTAASYLLSLNANYHVKIVGEIPSGFPAPSVPSIGRMGGYLSDSFTVAIIAFSVCISLSKIFAKKHNYEVNSNQELLAYGLSNFVSSFFHCYPAASSLSRSAVQDSMNGKTQLAGIISCGLLIFVLLIIGPLFESVPNCCLAAIILVALKGMFIHATELPKLWRLSKWDSWTWIISAAATVLLDVDYGLIIGVAFSILSVVFRMQAPSSHLLGRISNTDIYKNVAAYSMVEEIEGVKIFRYEGSVYYACCEHFRETIFDQTGYNPQKILIEMKRLEMKLERWKKQWKTATKKSQKKSIPNNTDTNLVEKDMELSDMEYACRPGAELDANQNRLLTKRREYLGRLKSLQHLPVHHIIIDASTWGFIDHAGVLTLTQIIQEYNLIGITVFLANPKTEIREMLSRSEFHRSHEFDCIYVTVHDAVLEALYEFKTTVLDRVAEESSTGPHVRRPQAEVKAKF